MKEISVSQMGVLTGYDYKTIKKRLEGLKPVGKDGAQILYLARAALPLLYQVESVKDEEGNVRVLDLTQERAKLTKIQTQKAELELKAIEKKLIPVEVIEREWESLIANARAKILSIPTKLAPRVAAISDPRKVEDEIIRECKEALIELSNYDPTQETSAGDADDSGEVIEAVGPAAST